MGLAASVEDYARNKQWSKEPTVTLAPSTFASCDRHRLVPMVVVEQSEGKTNYHAEGVE